MSSPAPKSPAAVPKTDQPLPKMDPLGGLLSYLIPGLGQISQGRMAKGIVFFVALYGLFFYGMALGQMKNVYLPDTNRNATTLGRLPADLYDRPHFVGQVFIGVAAWPALVQYYFYDKNAEKGPWFGNFQRTPPPDEINSLQRNSNKSWDLGWVYTVIAGVLNILVIYDAIAGPAFREVKVKTTDATSTPAGATTS